MGLRERFAERRRRHDAEMAGKSTGALVLSALLMGVLAGAATFVVSEPLPAVGGGLGGGLGTYLAMNNARKRALRSAAGRGRPSAG